MFSGLEWRQKGKKNRYSHLKKKKKKENTKILCFLMSTVSEAGKEGKNTVNHGIAEDPLKAGQN